MNGKIVAASIVIAAAASAIGVYYAQIYGYYSEVSADAAGVELTSLISGEPEPILFEDFQAIEASSSPIRYRACFTTSHSQAMLTETFETFDRAVPLVAPGWFDCFNAVAIGTDIEDGNALAFLGQRNIAYGVDRIVAIYPDGRGFAWHQLNECGERTYDGTDLGNDCPEREE